MTVPIEHLSFEGAALQLLTEIRDLLARPLPIEEAPPAPACPHPDELRINLRAMGDRLTEHFKCRACGRLVQVPAPSTLEE
jgi:hypothetical protein